MAIERHDNVLPEEAAFTSDLLALARAVEAEGGAESPRPEAGGVAEWNRIRMPQARSVLPLLALFASGFILSPSLTAQAIRDLPGFKSRSVPRNDDGSGPFVSLPFPINFFGRLRGGCWVNNNGNITFDRALSTYTPFGLESTRTEIIAPFFADVDTRGQRSRLVTFGEDTVNGRQAFGANYLDVGYYASHDEKLNRFQVILIDRSDTGSGNFDVEFNYERIVWETGDASGGSNGFGGVPAAAGWSNGSGLPGTSFQLPGSLTAGAFLDSGSQSLARRRLNSPVIGRYLFRARDGQLSPGLRITSGSPLPNGRLGSAYSTVLSAEGGSAYQWTLLPDPGQSLPWLSLSPAGILSGTPTVAGTYQFTVRVTSRIDGLEESAAQRVTLVVLPATLQILSGTCPLPEATEGAVYRQTLRAAGAPGPYLWSWGENGASPVSGLALSEDGVLAGTPTTAGSYNFVVRVAGNPRSEVEAATRVCALTVRARPSQLTVSSCPSPAGTAGVGYDEMVQAAGGARPYRWRALGALPPGISFSESGRLAGIPAGTGGFVYAVEVTDAVGLTSRLTCNLNIEEPGLTVETACPLAPVDTGQALRIPLDVSGGMAPYVWSAVGTLPPGLVLSPEGTLQGTPNGAGAYQFQLVVRDRDGRAAGKPCAIGVRRAPLSISSCPLPPAQLGQSYEANLAVEGGVAPYLWTANGALPPGLTVSSEGRLRGIPARPGTSTFQLTVRDANGLVATQQCEQFVTPNSLRLQGECPLPPATVGSFYRAQAIADGGIPPYRFRAEGQLPAGVVLNLDGWFTGTPREPRKGEVTVVAEDSRRAIVTRTCALQADLPEPANLRLVGTPSVVNPAGGSLPLVLQLDRAYPLPISGLLSLESQPDTGVADDRVNQADPAVVFAANGRRQLPFSLPAGQLRFAATITGPGSVAGYLMARVERLEIAGQAQVATPGAARVTVLRTAPGLTDACYAVAAGQLTLRVTGASSTRDLTAITAFLNGNELKDLSIGPYAADYFSSELSIRTGGTFQLEIPLPTPSSTNAIRVDSLRVSLGNKIGTSVERTARACN
ncbi:MAG: putative Ig domain-containing protein [Acidobacteriaceae bacterium]|nr:putative Ig domain-containing protein [Acidobacteriaceae bacterium]